MITLAREDILRACSSKKFARLLAAKSPFPDISSLLMISKEIWWEQVGVNRSLVDFLKFEVVAL